MDLYYDFHIHSCLSPCGEEEMTPGNIAGMAAVKGLNVIALTDHNSVRNAPALKKAAKEYNVMVIPGMELSTMEEVHCLCLFSDMEKALEFDKYVYDNLQKIPNKPEIFGEQLIMDENDNVIGEEPNLLINATNISFDDVYDIVKSYEGIMIPSHLDKSTTSLLSNLGFIPENVKFKCAEINQPDRIDEIIKAQPYLGNCNIITDSDAHMLGVISEPEHIIKIDKEDYTERDILEILEKKM